MATAHVWPSRAEPLVRVRETGRFPAACDIWWKWSEASRPTCSRARSGERPVRDYRCRVIIGPGADLLVDIGSHRVEAGFEQHAVLVSPSLCLCRKPSAVPPRNTAWCARENSSTRSPRMRMPANLLFCQISCKSCRRLSIYITEITELYRGFPEIPHYSNSKILELTCPPEDHGR